MRKIKPKKREVFVVPQEYTDLFDAHFGNPPRMTVETVQDFVRKCVREFGEICRKCFRHKKFCKCKQLTLI
jgi:hypothetical protein